MKFNENKLREKVDAAKSRLEKQTFKVGKLSLRLTSTLIYLGCLLCAVFIWANVSEDSTVTATRRFDNVSVVVEGEASLARNDLAVFELLDKTVSITVEGAKNKVDELTDDDIVAYIDVSDVNVAGNARLSVSVRGAGKLDTVVSPTSVKTFIDEKTEVDIPVNVIPTYSISSGYDLTYSSNIDTVTVSGAKSIIDDVKEARVTPELGDLFTGTTSSSPIMLVDANGAEITSNYISTNVTSVVVKVDVFAEKTVPLTYSFKYGYIQDRNIKVSLSPAEITLRGDPAILNEITSLPIIEIDETKLSKGTDIIVNPPLPEGVKDINQTNRFEVSIELLRYSSNTINISGSSIIVRNPHGHTYSLRDEIFELSYIVDTNSAKKVSAEDFTLEIDMSSIGADAEGSYSITPTVTVNDSGYTLYPVDIGQVSLDIIGAGD